MSSRKSGHDGTSTAEKRLLIRVIKADLLDTVVACGTFGNISVLTEVNFSTPRSDAGVGPSRTHVGCTPVDYAGHLNPVWNYACLGPSEDLFAEIEGELEFCVCQCSSLGVFGTGHMNLGKAVISCCKLVHFFQQEAAKPGTFSGTVTPDGACVAIGMKESPRKPKVASISHAAVTWRSAPRLELPLLGYHGQVTGKLTIKVLFIPLHRSPGGEADAAVLGSQTFETPVEAISVSGGTASFYRLILSHAALHGRSPTYFIGKDLKHAPTEMEFYDDMLRARAVDSNISGLGLLLELMFEYAGKLVIPSENCKPPPKKAPGNVEMLVLRNLFDEVQHLRMLDIKLGRKTASAGWQRKSYLSAARQAVQDLFLTNSGFEGFRLEGFESQPRSLESQDPLLHWAKIISPKTARKGQIGILQGHEVFKYLVDVHLEPAHPGDSQVHHVLTPTELAEITLHEVATRLQRLSIACRCVFFPQKWVGSSVCLGFNSGALPKRAGGEAAARKAVRVNIFDWGRSELNTIERMHHLSEKELHDRTAFWRLYVGAVDRLTWEATSAYYHQFGNVQEWSKVTVSVFDYNAIGREDFLGSVDIDLTPKCRHTAPLNFRQFGDGGLLTYSVDYFELPASSRMRAVWRVCIHKAEHLVIADAIWGTSDPYCVLEATGTGFRFVQNSSVKPSTLNPEWYETFEVPMMKSQYMNLPCPPTEVPKLLLPAGSACAEIDDALARFEVLLDEMSEPYGGESVAGTRVKQFGAK